MKNDEAADDMAQVANDADALLIKYNLLKADYPEYLPSQDEAEGAVLDQIAKLLGNFVKILKHHSGAVRTPQLELALDVIPVEGDSNDGNERSSPGPD